MDTLLEYDVAEEVSEYVLVLLDVNVPLVRAYLNAL